MDYFNSQSIIYLRICRQLCKSVEKAPMMYSIKSAIFLEENRERRLKNDLLISNLNNTKLVERSD